MAISYTPNLGLRIDPDLTTNAKANLYKLDQLGAIYRINADGAVFIRSSDGVTIQSGDASIGGTPGSQPVNIGSAGNHVSSFNINADAITSTVPIEYQYLDLTDSIVNADINSSAAIAYSKLNLLGSIVNADIAAAAAIAYSKLNLANSIKNSDVSNTAAIAYSKLNLALSLLNNDISPAAAIARSKLASGTPEYVLINQADGSMGEEPFLAKSRGGAGADMSAVTFPTDGDILTATNAKTVTSKIMSGSDNSFSDIPYSALSLTESIVFTDLSPSIIIPYSNLNLLNSIMNSDVNGSAAIEGTKISPNFGTQNIRTSGELQLSRDGFATGFKAPPSLGANFIWSLPDSIGLSGQVLGTLGTGELIWSTVMTATLSEKSMWVGNSSNLRQEVDTVTLGDIEASTADGLFIKDDVITNDNIATDADIEISKLNVDGTPSKGSVIHYDGAGYRVDGKTFKY